MTTAYLASFDLSAISPGTLTLSTSGESDIVINLATFTGTNLFSTNTAVFNHALSSSWLGFGWDGSIPLAALPFVNFGDSLTIALVAAATTATWSSPGSISASLSSTTWRYTFSYSGSFTAITWSSAVGRRLFGFSANFSGSSASVAGTQLPKYIILPTVEGASSVSVVGEDGVAASSAYSAGGRTYGLSKSTAMHTRDWTQQYETKAKTFRRFAASAPDEYTYQHLFEDGRAGIPFATRELFSDTHNYTAHVLRDASYHPAPATHGNSDQFHIPFRTYAVGRAA